MEADDILLMFGISNITNVLNEMKKVQNKEEYALVYQIVEELEEMDESLKEIIEEEDEDVLFVEFYYKKKDDKFYNNYEQGVFQYNKHIEDLFKIRSRMPSFNELPEKAAVYFVQKLIDEFNIIFEEMSCQDD